MDIKFLFLYLIIMLMNIIINAQFYFNSRKKIEYKWTLLFWSIFFLNFLCQGIFEKYYQLLGLSIVLVGVSYYYLLKLFGNLFKVELDHKLYAKVCGSLFGLGLIMSFNSSFTEFTIPLTLACVFPFFHFGYKNYQAIKKQSFLLKSGFLFFCISLLHVLDYPFLRLDPKAAEIGFFIAFMTTILFSLVIHLLSDSLYIKSIEQALQQSVEEKNKLSQKLMAVELVQSFSHEINNSLQTIELNNQMLSLIHSDEKTNKLSDNISLGLQRINEMFNLFEDGKKELSFQETTLNELILDVKKFIDVKNKSSYSQVSFSNSDHVLVNTSKGLFSQMMVSIISKLMDEKIKHIKVDSSISGYILVKTTGFDLTTVNFDLAQVLSHQLNLKIEKNKDQLLVIYSQAYKKAV